MISDIGISGGGSPAKKATKRKVAGVVIVLAMAATAPAFAHASFGAAATFGFMPNTEGGTGLTGSTPPYPANATRTVYTRVPDERADPFNGNPNTTVDVQTTVPIGWTDAACGAAKTNKNDVTTNNTNQPGNVVAGWTCMIMTSGPNTVLHWSGPPVVSPGTDLDGPAWFEFTVTTPSPAVQTTYNGTAGTEGFIVEQGYASGEVVRWIPNAAVPGGGVVAGGLARTVAGNPCHNPTLLGTPGNDLLVGTAGVDVIDGLAGEDILKGFGSDDILCGGAGNDRIEGGSGNDRTYGHDGDDVIQAQTQDDALDGGAGTDRCDGGAGIDTVTACEKFSRIP